MSVLKPNIGFFCVGMVLLGTALSYAIRMGSKNKKMLGMDAVLYTIAALLSLLFIRDLQSLMPDGGFPPELLTGSLLCWILSLGSFFCWRDNTLLFQAIPSIALFGLVGCYDTFRNVTFAFYGFVLCLATLFARANSRAMLRLAIDSGYFATLDGLSRDALEDEGTLYQRIKEGPWRWVAGAEWALASATIIVLVSVLGAPVIQATVKPIAGQLSLVTPASLRNAITSPSTSMETGGTVRVGRGPNNLRERPICEVRLDRLRYLRAETFMQYDSGTWKNPNNPLGPDLAELNTAALAIETIEKPKQFAWTVKPLIPMRAVPAPAEVISFESSAISQLPDGTLSFQGGPQTVEISGKSEEPESSHPKQAKQGLPAGLAMLKSAISITPKVRALAEEITKKAKTDGDKADRLMLEIGKRAKYNIKAEATPSGTDAVEYFLFDQKEGYCDLFATSMVMMARAVGLPARYVVGYLPSPQRYNGAGGYVVSETDYHAWAELFFEGEGWVIYDATTVAEDVEGGGRGDVGQKWYQAGWAKQALLGLLFCGLVFGGFAVYRVVQPMFKPKPARDQIRATYSKFASALHRHSKRRRKMSETPREYLNAVRPSIEPIWAETFALNERLEELLYGRPVPSPADSVAIAVEVRAWRKKLRNSKSK